MNDDYRLEPPPSGPARGRLVVGQAVVRSTLDALRVAGSRKPPHEGLVFLLGRESGTDILVLACCRPCVESGPRFVRADEASVGDVARRTRALRLGIVAQVHSHPSGLTLHSDGDDRYVLMPFEGMYSLVVADYGAGGFLPREGASLHQRQDGRWVLVEPADSAIIVVPSSIEMDS